MGSASSNISSESILTTVVVAGALTYGYFQYTRPIPAPAQPIPIKRKGGKKGKQAAEPSPKEAQPEAAPVVPGVVHFPTVVPGEFEASIEKPKKQKKKKGKRAGGAGSDAQKEQSEQQAGQSDSSAGPAVAKAKSAPKVKKAASPPQQAQRDPAPAEAQDERWTRVESRKKKVTSAAATDSSAAEGNRPKPTVSTADLATSDAGITTSVTTGNSSPATERTTEDELPVSGADESAPEASLSELPGQPRVIRIKPQPGEQPAKGFTWDDYEGVQVGNDADREDDGGWGVVKSKHSARINRTASGGQKPAAQSSNTPQTKKQRQNAAKREAQKQAKQDAALEQQTALERHKRELERVRMAEQFASPKGKARV